MSAFLYGDVTKKRLAADPKKSTDERPPGVKTYVDTFAALVPAEVLAVQALITGWVVAETTTNGTKAMVITYPNVVKWSFYALLLVSSGLYLLGLRQKPRGWDFVRMLIPPIAFAGWTALQPHTFFNVVFPDFAGVPARVFAVIVAFIRAVAANRLGSVADKSTPVAGPQQQAPPAEATDGSRPISAIMSWVGFSR